MNPERVPPARAFRVQRLALACALALAGACGDNIKLDGNDAACGDGKVTGYEVCDPGVDACCSDTCDAALSAGTECRASSGPCDVAEVCDGTNITCPADRFAAPQVECRASTDLCDAAEKCPGTGTDCPPDMLADDATVCRAAAGECDLEELCTGSDAACPADGFADDTTMCSTCPLGPGNCVCNGAGVCAPASGVVVINEVDSDTAGFDVLEFVELYDGGSGNTSLDGMVLVFYDGLNVDASYMTIDLGGHATDANGYFVVGNAGVSPAPGLVIANNSIENGPDSVGLYIADASDFPVGTPVPTSTPANLLDYVVYDNTFPDDPQLLAPIPGQPQINEDEGGKGASNSIQRSPDGQGGPLVTTAYTAASPTPGAANN